MNLTGGEIVVRALEAEGIRHCFGIPGTHNIELYDALGAAESVRPVLVTDEQSASFAADGYWRASGRMACVNIVPGAGLTHALSGIAEAYLDHVPMLVLGCGIRRDTGASFQLHDVDQQALAGPVTKATFLPLSGGELWDALRDACRIARSGAPGPVFVEVPADLYMFKHDVDLADPPSTPEPSGPDPDLVARAAALLRAARRPLLYVGAGGVAAVDRVRRLAELLEAPVSTTIQGKGVFPESHPLFLWPGFGDAAPPFVRRVARSCDATLAIGCRFAEVGTGSYGLKPPGLLIHVDVDPDVLGRNFPAELAIASDAGRFLGALLEELAGAEPAPPDQDLREEIRVGHARIRKQWHEEAGGAGVTPARLLETLQRRLGLDAVYATDSGNGTFLAMECLRLEAPRRFLAPVDYSCMGYSVPAAFGAKLALPDSPVVALVGDGAFLMTGLELLSAVREGAGVMAFVLRDGELAQISQFQATALSRKVASELPAFDLEHVARGVGAEFLDLESDNRIEEQVARARALSEEGRPVLVDVAVDYSRKTWFTRGVVKTNLLRLPVKDRLRMVGRALLRRVTE